MNIEDKDKWIGNLREKLEGYSEEVPHNLWDNLEKELAPKTIPLWKRWQSIAAISLIAIVSSVMVYFWNASAPVNYMQNENNTIATEINKRIESAKEDDINQLAISHGGVAEDIDKRICRSERKNNEISVVPLVENDEKQAVRSQEESCAGANKIEQGSKDEAKVKKNVQRKRKYEYNANPAKRAQRWSVAINSGGFGVNSTSNVSGAMVRFNTGTQEAMQYDVMSFPNINGASYLSNSYTDLKSINSIKTKKKHYQPITFGLSLKFDIDKEWAVETGLTYTYLFSKLESATAGNAMKQEQKLRYIGVPLKLSRSIVTINKLNIYGSAGGEIEKCISAEIKDFNNSDNKEVVEGKESVDISQLQFSLSTSLGVEYKLNNRFGIYAEPGVVYYFDDKSAVETIRKEHPLNFNLKLGLRFTFPK